MNRNQIPNAIFATVSVAAVPMAGANGAYAVAYPLQDTREAGWPRAYCETKPATYRVKNAANTTMAIPGRATVFTLTQTKYNEDGTEAGSLRIRIQVTCATEAFTSSEIADGVNAAAAFMTDAEGQRMFTLGEACTG